MILQSCTHKSNLIVGKCRLFWESRRLSTLQNNCSSLTPLSYLLCNLPSCYLPQFNNDVKPEQASCEVEYLLPCYNM